MGFFMPMACNQNGFEIAEFFGGFNSPNLSSIALYGLFFFSCIGGILLLLLVMKKPINSAHDWIVELGVLVSAIVVCYKFSDSISVDMLQTGTYFVLVGLLISLIFLIMASSKGEQSIKTKEDTNETE
jgi:hypothetical protein